MRYQKADDDARDVRIQMTVDDDSDGDDDDIMSQTSLHCRQRHTHSLRHRQQQQQQRRREGTKRAREGRNAEHRDTGIRDRGAENRRYATAARPNYR